MIPLQSLVTTGWPSVWSSRLNTAAVAAGFMTTIHPSSPRSVVPSGMNHVRPSVRVHGSEAIPDCEPPARAAHAAPTHPPKYSSSVDAPRVSALTGTLTSDVAATDSVLDTPAPACEKVVTRIGTGRGPGLVTESWTCQPAPPPCGQNHA